MRIPPGKKSPSFGLFVLFLYHFMSIWLYSVRASVSTAAIFQERYAEKTCADGHVSNDLLRILRAACPARRSMRGSHRTAQSGHRWRCFSDRRSSGRSAEVFQTSSRATFPASVRWPPASVPSSIKNKVWPPSSAPLRKGRPERRLPCRHLCPAFSLISSL